MYNLLLKNISEVVDLTQNDRDIIKGFFTPKKLKKKQFLLQKGNTCDKFTFVAKGTLVTYSTDEKGNEHVISFSFEGLWVADLVSLFCNEESNLDIEALEACDLLQLNASQEESLFLQVPAYERFSRIKYQNTCADFQKRIESSLGLTADEKYKRFIKHSPFIVGKIPLSLIASYLGVTPETISRVRKTHL